MGKAVKNILSPGIVKTVDGILQKRAEDKERQVADLERNRTLLSPDGHVDVTNREAQKGRALSRATLVHRIKKLNPNLWYEQSLRYPAQGGLYINDERSPYGKRMVCGFPHESVNEFSVRITVPEIRPAIGHQLQWETIQRVDQQEPGWRAVLLTLLKEGLLTASGIDKEFKITQGRSSQHWQNATN